MSLRDSILAAGDIAREPVDVPEWGVTVYVRAMDGVQRDELDEWFRSRPRDESGASDQRGFRAMVVALCACDDAGVPLFTLADLDAIAAKSATAIERVFDAAARLNKLMASDAEKAKSDFSTPQTAGSGIG